jgi:hypothetical protein
MTEIGPNEIEGTGVYEDRLLAFLDILGFSNLIEGSVNQQSLARTLCEGSAFPPVKDRSADLADRQLSAISGPAQGLRDPDLSSWHAAMG